MLTCDFTCSALCYLESRLSPHTLEIPNSFGTLRWVWKKLSSCKDFKEYIKIASFLAAHTHVSYSCGIVIISCMYFFKNIYLVSILSILSPYMFYFAKILSRIAITRVTHLFLMDYIKVLTRDRSLPLKDALIQEFLYWIYIPPATTIMCLGKRLRIDLHRLTSITHFFPTDQNMIFFYIYCIYNTSVTLW